MKHRSDDENAAQRSSGRTRRSAVLAILLLICLGVAAYRVFSWTKDSPERPVPTSSDGTLLLPKLAVIVPELPSSKANRESRGIEADMDGPQTGEVVPQHEDSDRRYLQLEFHSEDGETVSGTRFEIICYEQDKYSPSQKLQVGNDGRVVLAFGATTTRIDVHLTDMDWHADSVTIELSGVETSRTVVLHRLVDVEFDIRYEDGDPFIGRASFSMGYALPPRHSASSPTHDTPARTWGGRVEGKPVTIVGISPRDTVLNLYCERPGYDRFDAEIRKEQLYHGAKVYITIARPQKEYGNIVVHFDKDQWPERTVRWRYALTPDHYKGSEKSSSNTSVPPPVFIMHTILAGSYTLTITDETRVWATTLTVTGSEETHVYADMQSPASATVRVLDESGNPISGACLYSDSRVYVDYPVRERKGFAAATNSEGFARLEGLPFSVQELLVDAPGYDLHRTSVVLSSGQTTDLGTVKLIPAAGVIEIRLLNSASEQTFQAMCIHPWGRGGESSRTGVSADGTIRFERMKLREYLVAVHPAGGGRVVSKNVSLSAAEHHVIVELDVAALQRSQE